MVKMLDLVGLPKNTNGFRTTHTCELCGFEPKTKNKYREKQDHLVMKHFKEKIDKIFPHCRPYTCPAASCEFTGKDKQALLRHYTGKHGILEQFLREALSERGINYAPGDFPKRKNSTDSKKNRASPSLAPAVVLAAGPPQPPTAALVDPKNLLPSVPLSSSSLMGAVGTVTRSPQIPKPNNEELAREVEAMMASFTPTPNSTTAGVNEPSQAAPPPLVVSLPQMPTLNLVSAGGSVAQNGLSSGVPGNAANGIKINQVIRNIPGNGGPVSITLPTVPIQSPVQHQHASQGVPKLTPAAALPTAPLPPMSLILPQEPAKIPSAAGISSHPPTTPVSKGPLPSLISNGRIIKTPSTVQLVRRSPPPMPQETMPDLMLPTSVSNGFNGNIQLPTLPSVLTIQQPSKLATKLGNLPPGACIPMPIESFNGPRNSVNSDPDSTPPSSIAMDDPMEMTAEQTAVVLENEEIMWSAPMDGPAVVVEVADTVPVTYITTADIPNVIPNGVVSVAATGTNGEVYCGG